jgi:formylglycine-generating enzyme required for sulfatase activity
MTTTINKTSTVGQGLALTLAAVLAVVGCGRVERPQQGPSRPQSAIAPQTVTTKSGIEMMSLPAGTFTMGDNAGDTDEQPTHQVRISGFLIDVREVTQQSYEKLMGKNPAKFKNPDSPVERASWVSAAQYCNMRSSMEGFAPCYDTQTYQCDFTADGYRLPTEAEWEYACRAGTTTPWSFGAGEAQLAKHAWFKINGEKTTHPVGRKETNPWGLRDMHGNVAEWCNDFYAESYQHADGALDPKGPASGEERVLRGGSWKSSPDSCRSSARYSEPPGFADVCFGYEAYGFRCLRRAPEEPADARQ